MTKRKYVDVTVSWGNDDCTPTAKISLAEWEDIRNGKKVSASTTYWYEGEKYDAYFEFNEGGRGNLRVSYANANEDWDGGEGFIGTIAEADILGGTFEG